LVPAARVAARADGLVREACEEGLTDVEATVRRGAVLDHPTPVDGAVVGTAPRCCGALALVVVSDLASAGPGLTHRITVSTSSSSAQQELSGRCRSVTSSCSYSNGQRPDGAGVTPVAWSSNQARWQVPQVIQPCGSRSRSASVTGPSR